MVHSCKNFRSSILGCTSHFHHAWYFNWYALEIQCLHLKTETRLLTYAFVCKHQVVVWNSVLSEQFDEPAVICNSKDGLRWVIFFLLKIWVSYFPITIYLENLSTSTQKSNRIIVWTMAQKHMEGMVQEEGMLDKIGIVHWMSLPNTPIPWTTSVINCTTLSQEICFRATQCYKCRLSVCG